MFAVCWCVVEEVSDTRDIQQRHHEQQRFSSSRNKMQLSVFVVLFMINIRNKQAKAQTFNAYVGLYYRMFACVVKKKCLV